MQAQVTREHYGDMADSTCARSGADGRQHRRSPWGRLANRLLGSLWGVDVERQPAFLTSVTVSAYT